jgi:hypothetical protein
MTSASREEREAADFRMLHTTRRIHHPPKRAGGYIDDARHPPRDLRPEADAAFI